MHLATVPSGIRWVSWSRKPEQRRVVGQPAGERRRDRHDGAAGPDLGAVRAHHDAVRPVPDRPHRVPEQHAARPSSSAMRIAISCEPPTKRSCCAPPSVSKSIWRLPAEWM